MRKIYSICLFAFVSISVMSFVSCSKKDDSSSAIPNASIVGKWKGVSATKNGVAIVYQNPCPTDNNYVEFLADKSLIASVNVLRNSGSPNSFCQLQVFNQTYDVEGDILITYRTGNEPSTIKSKIISITTNELVTKQFYDKHLTGNPPLPVEIITPESEQIISTSQRIN
jgi:hypothetical protein